MLLLLKTKDILSTDVQDIISTYDIVIINEAPLSQMFKILLVPMILLL